MRASLIFMAHAVAIAWVVLALAVVPWFGGQGLLIHMFSADAERLNSSLCFVWGLAQFLSSARCLWPCRFYNSPLLSTTLSVGPRHQAFPFRLRWWGSLRASGALIAVGGGRHFWLLAMVVAWRTGATGQAGQPPGSAVADASTGTGAILPDAMSLAGC
jgi:hypothetical protein